MIVFIFLLVADLINVADYNYIGSRLCRTPNVMRSVWRREKLIMSFISFSPKKTIIGIVFYWRGDKLIKENRETLSCPTVAIPPFFVGRTSVLEINRLDDLLQTFYLVTANIRQEASSNTESYLKLESSSVIYLLLARRQDMMMNRLIGPIPGDFDKASPRPGIRWQKGWVKSSHLHH